MSYTPETDSGMAKRKQFMHIPSADFENIVQGSNLEALESRNYAVLVYQINSTPLSGQEASLNYLSELAIDSTYSRKVETWGTDTYIAHAPPGSTEGASVWRVKKIDSAGSLQWADGNTNFDNAVSAVLSGLTYSY